MKLYSNDPFEDTYCQILKDKVEDYIYYPIYNVIRNIIVIVKWIPILWGDRDWDYQFLLDIVRYKLTRMAELQETVGNGLHADRYARQMRIAAHLLKRIADDEYDQKERAAIWASRKRPGKDILEGLNEPWSDAENKRFHRHYEKSEALQKHDLELFAKLFSKHVLNWWD